VEGFVLVIFTKGKKTTTKKYSLSRILIQGQTVAITDTSIKTYRTGPCAFQFSYFFITLRHLRWRFRSKR